KALAGSSRPWTLTSPQITRVCRAVMGPPGPSYRLSGPVSAGTIRYPSALGTRVSTVLVDLDRTWAFLLSRPFLNTGEIRPRSGYRLQDENPSTGWRP